MVEVPRRLEPITRDSLSGLRVVVITGPRQAGKTTSVRRTLAGAGTLARFLNGSADFLTVPAISESLAGRAAFLELWPFSQGELHGAPYA